MIGKRRHRVTFQRNDVVRTKGVKTDRWVDMETVYASVEPVSGGETVTALQKNGRVMYRIETRYRPTVEGADFKFLDGTLFTFLDGTQFTFLGINTGPLARHRVTVNGKECDVREVLTKSRNPAVTVLTVEERV